MSWYRSSRSDATESKCAIVKRNATFFHHYITDKLLSWHKKSLKIPKG